MNRYKGKFKFVMETPFLKNEMVDWIKKYGDVHWTYSLTHITMYFVQEDDMTAFRLVFGV